MPVPRHILQSRHMMPLLRTSCVLALAAASLAAPLAAKDPFDVQALLRILRINEPQLSPDGKTVAFTVQTPNIDQNTKPNQVYVVPAGGGVPRQITSQGTDNERPRWS